MKNKRSIVVITLAFIAVLFIIGADWASETARRLFHSYFADIAIPFSFYFLLVLLEEDHKLFQKWYVKALTVLVLCSSSETLQYFGIYALARVFDPLDYLMYAVGVILAAVADRMIYQKIFSFWK